MILKTSTEQLKFLNQEQMMEVFFARSKEHRKYKEETYNLVSDVFIHGLNHEEIRSTRKAKEPELFTIHYGVTDVIS